MKTTEQWWAETKSNPAKLNHWLQRQYVGEFAAVNLLSLILLRYGSEMTDMERENVYKVMTQEALHGHWMSELLSARGVKPESQADATRRYWEDVLPNVTCFREAMQAAAQAESMRLYRIRTIAADDTADIDIQATFKRILPHEEWHEQVFTEMRGSYHSEALANGHQVGLKSLELVLS